ncbi:MAG: sodium:calcium antiporter [Pseudolabrys sp.]
MWMPWLKFAFCVSVIGVAGPALSYFGDIIAQRTGVSRSWVGLVLLASATSLPELFTSVSALTVADAPNIAVGDLLGACIFNLVSLVVLDALSREEPMYRRIDQGHILTAGFGIILIGFTGALILLSRDGFGPHLFHVSLYTPIIIILYFVATRAAYVYEKRGHREAPAAVSAGVSLKAALVRYLLAAAAVGAAGSWLPFIGVEIARVMGWHTTFVGTLFIGVATTLPELAVTISALRLGAVDLAIGNLLGSNLFDILILAVGDLIYVKGPLFAAVSPAHAISAFAAVIMSGIFIVAMLYRPETRIRGTIGWVSLSLLLVYLFSAYAIYLHGHQ